MYKWRFGSGDDTYYFPPTVHTFSDTFGDMVPQTVRLPGVSGGFDNFGIDPAPSEIGKVTLGFTLMEDWAQRTYSESDAAIAIHLARDAVQKMAAWGKKKLFRTIYGTTERFCWARVNNINMAQNDDRHTHLWQPVNLIFQASEPFWYTIGTEAPEWGEVEWGLFVWGGTATPTACSGTSTTWTETVGGSAETYPRITIIAGAGGAENVRLQRLVDGAVVDEVSFADALTEDEQLEINCRALTVKRDTDDAYTSDFDFERPNWMTLYPGANSMRLLMDGAGNECDVYMRYYEAYRS